MNPLNRHLRTSPEGITLIASFEGFRSHPYDDGKGVWTIGFGHTSGVTPHTAPVTSQEARTLLRGDVILAERAVKRLVKVRLSQRQFDAVVSMVFNLGPGDLLDPKQSHFARYLNEGRFARAANRMADWSDPGLSTHAGLLRRRAAERKLFLRGSNRKTRIAAATGVR